MHKYIFIFGKYKLVQLFFRIYSNYQNYLLSVFFLYILRKKRLNILIETQYSVSDLLNYFYFYHDEKDE
jgi:hypothetical protein